MIVKMNGKTSSTLDLIGGGPQGSIIGQLLYIIASDDVAEDTPEEEKFKYIDDLSLVEAITTKNNLIQYDVSQPLLHQTLFFGFRTRLFPFQ